MIPNTVSRQGNQQFFSVIQAICFQGTQEGLAVLSVGLVSSVRIRGLGVKPNALPKDAKPLRAEQKTQGRRRIDIDVSVGKENGLPADRRQTSNLWVLR